MTFRTIYGRTHSENGWRNCDSNECITLFYAGKPVLIRNGDAATVLRTWMDWYNSNVEPIKSQVWGWSATNEVASSNHISATGVDINAPWHPWKVDASKNFTQHQIARAREGLRLFEGNIFWGQDWGRRDPMHWQLNSGTASGDGASGKLAAFAQKIRDGKLGSTGPVYVPPPAAPNARPVVRIGATGQAVRDLQARLNRDYPLYSKLVVDGDFGPATDRVVREFQTRARLVVDGIVGPATWNALGL